MAGCRCADCRNAHTVKERERRAVKRGTPKKQPRKESSPHTIKKDYSNNMDTLTRGELCRARGWEE